MSKTTGRFVVVFSDTHAVPFSTQQAAVAYMKLMLTKNLARAGVGRTDPGVYADDEKCWQTTAEPTIFMQVSEEGPDGVYSGFDTADRESFAVPLGVEPEDFPGWGDGDPYIYDTIGAPNGTMVKSRLVTDTNALDAKYGYKQD